MTMENLCLILRPLNFNIKSKRTLFQKSFLGLDRYYKRRAMESQSIALKQKFEALSQNPELRILSHDFKKFVYVVNTEEDFKRFCDIFDRYAYSESNSKGNIKFQIFNIGPEIMRVYYAMNKPVEAFSLIKNTNTVSFVSSLKALIILQDLLYENELYQEVCEVFDFVREKQFYGKVLHFASYVLFQAACYKMNTSQSYDNVITLFQKFVKQGSNPEWPMLMYTLMYALKNSSFDIPAKYASGSDPASVNIKLSALIKSENYSDALNFCNTLQNKSVIMKSVAEDLCKPLESDGTAQDEYVMKRLQKFKVEISQLNLIEKTLDELAENVIASVRSQKSKLLS